MGLLTIFGIAAAIFWGVTFGPFYLERFDVQDVVTTAANLVATGQLSEEQAKDWVVNKLEYIGTHYETNDDGVEVEKGGLGVTAEDVSASTDSGSTTIAVRYSRVVLLRPTKDRTVEQFFVSKTQKVGR